MTNEVLLTGKVISIPVLSHTTHNIDFYMFYVSVKRASGKKDVIKCIKQGDASFIEKGKSYSIVGRIKSYKDEHLDNYVFADTIIENADDSKNDNQVEFECYVCSKPLFSDQIKNGKKISKFLVVCNHANSSYYIPVMTWGIYAEFSKSFETGTHIRCFGRLETRNIKNHERTVTELSVNRLEVIQ